jgi:hypothetical protein
MKMIVTLGVVMPGAPHERSTGSPVPAVTVAAAATDAVVPAAPAP